MYDVAIVGAGVIGANIARQLSQYKLNVVLIDKEADVSFGTSKANSGIIHGGFHTTMKYLKSKLEIDGNKMFDKLQAELHFPFKRVGILVVAFNEEEMSTVQTLYEQGVNNGSDGIEICNRDRMLQLEPKLNPDVIGGLFSPIGGIIEPYRFVFALVESAKQNGVTIKTNFEVVQGTQKDNYYSITSKDGQTIDAKYVINCAGLFADEISRCFGAELFNIKTRKGEEFLLDKNALGKPSRVVFPVPSANSKGMLVIPTVEGTTMVGPTAVDGDDKYDLSTSSDNLEKVFQSAKRLVPSISERDIITSFAGIRPVLDSGDFYIAQSQIKSNFIQVAGIQSPGLTASPAIAVYVSDILRDCGCALEKKSDYVAALPESFAIRDMSLQDLDKLISKEPDYGNVVCRCEKISEAEIIEAIHQGHTTLDGVKFYTRASMGRCQGGFCSYKIIKIIMRETGLSYEEVTKRGGASRVLSDKL